jgi:hypothetical protein
MGRISSEALEMGIASFIEKRGYAGLRIELTPQQALDIYTELQLLRELAISAACLIGSPDNGMFEQQYKDAVEKWEEL